MERIERIFFRKINPSDFKKLYDIDRPAGGGGQTYLEAAGISNQGIVDFLSYAEISNSPLDGEERSIYTFNAYVLGGTTCAMIEFAPRGGRNNYRISRQNMRYKHPAWSLENGFPEPGKNAAGEYTSEGNFEGIIDNLVIMIIRTSFRKYYAGFINCADMPETWPVNIGLEKMFQGERRGVLRFNQYKVEFLNDKENPFNYIEPIDRISGGTNVLLYGVPGSGKSWTIEHEYCPKGSHVERLVFHPDYTNSDFVGQILPVVDKENDNQVTYEFTPGPFTTILRDAYDNPQQVFILVIEELNRGNAPAIFGDVFQLLDRTVLEKTVDGVKLPVGTSEYEITNKNVSEVVYQDASHKIRIPSNLSILATMNTFDQNVFTLDTAFQRRWKMRLIENSFDNVRPSLADCPILDTGVTWRRFCETINKQIVGNKAKMASSEDKRLGVYFVHENDLAYNDADQPVAHASFLAELNELLKAEMVDSITDEQKVRLQEIRAALIQNRIFPEKVIKYLWDDAFKFNTGAIFDTEENKELDSLEAVIRMFVYENRGKDRFRIFKSAIRDLLYES